MSLQFLLDTDICIYIGKNRLNIGERFLALKPGEAAVSLVTFGELVCGAMKRGTYASQRNKWDELVHFLPVLPLPYEAAEKYGAIRAHLALKGLMIGNGDLWIAAHALAAGLTLVTNNEREFRRVPGLSVQNWTK